MRSPIHIGHAGFPSGSLSFSKSPRPEGSIQTAGRTAAIALPTRGIDRVASEHQRAAWTCRKRARVSKMKIARLAALARNHEGARLAFVPGAWIGDEMNLTSVGAPADDVRDGRTQKGQALRLAAGGGHDIDFGIAVVV